MSLRRPIAGALALVVCLGAVLIGCGSGGSQTSTSEFQIDVPGVTTTPGAEPGSGTGVTPGQLDTKENDLPPEPGSPQDAFEKFCREHPDACG